MEYCFLLLGWLYSAASTPLRQLKRSIPLRSLVKPRNQFEMLQSQSMTHLLKCSKNSPKKRSKPFCLQQPGSLLKDPSMPSELEVLPTSSSSKNGFRQRYYGYSRYPSFGGIRGCLLFAPLLLCLVIQLSMVACKLIEGELVVTGQSVNLTVCSKKHGMLTFNVIELYREVEYSIYNICPAVDDLRSALEEVHSYHCLGASGEGNCGPSFSGFYNKKFHNSTKYYGFTANDGFGDCLSSWDIDHCLAISPREDVDKMYALVRKSEMCNAEVRDMNTNEVLLYRLVFGKSQHKLSLRSNCQSSFPKDALFINNKVLLDSGPRARFYQNECPMYWDERINDWNLRSELLHVRKTGFDSYKVDAEWLGIPSDYNNSVVGILHPSLGIGRPGRVVIREPISEANLLYSLEIDDDDDLACTFVDVVKRTCDKVSYTFNHWTVDILGNVGAVGVCSSLQPCYAELHYVNYSQYHIMEMVRTLGNLNAEVRSLRSSDDQINLQLEMVRNTNADNVAKISSLGQMSFELQKGVKIVEQKVDDRQQRINSRMNQAPVFPQVPPSPIYYPQMQPRVHHMGKREINEVGDKIPIPANMLSSLGYYTFGRDQKCLLHVSDGGYVIHKGQIAGVLPRYESTRSKPTDLEIKLNATKEAWSIRFPTLDFSGATDSIKSLLFWGVLAVLVLSNLSFFTKPIGVVLIGVAVFWFVSGKAEACSVDASLVEASWAISLVPLPRFERTPLIDLTILALMTMKYRHHWLVILWTLLGICIRFSNVEKANLYLFIMMVVRTVVLHDREENEWIFEKADAVYDEILFFCKTNVSAPLHVKVSLIKKSLRGVNISVVFGELRVLKKKKVYVKIRRRNVRNMKGTLFYASEYEMLKERLKTLPEKTIRRMFVEMTPLTNRDMYDLVSFEKIVGDNNFYS